MGFVDLTDRQRTLVTTAVEMVEVGGYASDFVWQCGRSQGVEFEWALVFTASGGSRERITGDFQRTDLLALCDLGYITLDKKRDDMFMCGLKQKAFDQYHSSEEPTSEPGSEPQAFSFVTNADLKSICLRDFREARLCSEAGAYKATVVMCGSVMEALLLDALENCEQEAKASEKAPRDKAGKVRDLDRWSLGHMIDVAFDLEIIRKDTHALMPDQIREYRNLVHPAVERRKGIPLEEEEARASRSALDLVIKNLRSSP